MTNANVYVRQLNEVQQTKVKELVHEALTCEGLQGEELSESIENAMDSKVSDLVQLIEMEMIT